MFILSEKNICLNCYAQTKLDAIDVVYKGLLDNQNVNIGFKVKMLEREKQFSTYLMNGIAIPHGSIDAQSFVKKTGIFIAQFKHGIDWGDGNIAYLVIGIAANSEEHLTLLKDLTHILKNQKKINQLILSNNPQDFLNVFNLSENITSKCNPSESQLFFSTDQAEAIFTIHNQHGLHARPAAILARLANQYSANIYVSKNNKKNDWVNAKSLVQLLRLAVKHQEQLKFLAQGSDAAEAIYAIQRTIQDGLGEPH